MVVQRDGIVSIVSCHGGLFIPEENEEAGHCSCRDMYPRYCLSGKWQNAQDNAAATERRRWEVQHVRCVLQ